MQTTSETSHFPGNIAEEADARIDSLSKSTHRAVNRVADTASSVARQLGRKGNELLAVQHRWVACSRGAVCRHPLASLAIAVATGLLISRLSGRE